MNEGVIGKKIKKTKWEFFRRIRYCKLNIIRKRGDVKHAASCTCSGTYFFTSLL